MKWLALKEQTPADIPVVFVSKDINLRIKAAIAGIDSEDYENDRALDDFSLLYTGATALPADFWQRHGKDLRSWTDKGRTYYEVTMAEDAGWYPNQYLYLPGDDESEFRVARVEGDKATLQIVDDFRHSQHAVWGINARNREQNFALNALMDPESTSSPCSAPPAPARPCWHWPPAWRRRWTSSATARSS